MNKRMMLIILVLFILIGIVFSIFTSFSKKTFTYTESSRELINPDRGYYIQIFSSEPERIKEIKESGYRLVLLAVNLRKYTDRLISADKLNDIKRCLNEAKKHQIKVIFRAAYGFESEITEPADKELIASHIEQMAAVLNENKDVIYGIQAGLLGPYGEWHSSPYLEGTEQEKMNNRLFLLSNWEKYLDYGIELQVRRPRFVREAKEAGILTGRLGYHNDALLSTKDDMGTYDDSTYTREDELAYMDDSLKNTKNGGEMPIISSYNDPVNADKEFKKMHISFLNRAYNTEVFDKWDSLNYKGQNAKEYFKNHLGYRYYISNITCSNKIMNRKLKISLTLKNSGYAPIPEEYSFYLAVQGNGKIITEKLENKKLYTMCNNEGTRINETIVIPKELAGIEKGDKLTAGLLILNSAKNGGQDSVEIANDGFEYEDGLNELLEYTKTAFSFALSEN